MQYYSVEDLDDHAYEALAQEALASRPRPSSMWDERLYVSHAPILTRAVNQDDLLADSNYETVRDHLLAFSAVWDATASDRRECEFDRVGATGADTSDVICECEDCSPSVVDARISDWAYGPIDQLFIRTHWQDGTLTETWKEAMRIVTGLRDYPVFDESDYSEREWEAFEKDAQEALDYATRDYPDDSDSEVSEIMLGAADLMSSHLEYGGSEGADWNAVADLYRQARNSYFESRANDHLMIGANAQLPGQTEMEI